MSRRSSPMKKNGSSGRTRTYNPPVNSRMLCLGAYVFSVI
jgi:hypothetical protein